MPFTANKAILPMLPKPDPLIHGIPENTPLSAIEDKELRKKLRNRQSALAARERKKARMLELERQVMELQESHKRLENENHFLYSQLEFMRQKCLESGITFDEEKESSNSPYPSPFRTESLIPGNKTYFSNNNLERSPNLRPPLQRSEGGYAVNRTASNFAQNCSNFQFFSKTIDPYKNENERKFLPHQPNTFHQTNPPLNRSSSDFYPESYCVQNRLESNPHQMKIKQEEFETKFSISDSNSYKTNATVNRAASYPLSSSADQSSLNPPKPTQPISPSSTLPSISEMLETDVQQLPITIKRWSNFEMNPDCPEVGKQKICASHHAKYRHDASPYNFRKSRSFHSLNGMTTVVSKEEKCWSTPSIHEQCNSSNPTVPLISSPRTEDNTSNNNFSDFFGPKPKGYIRTNKPEVRNGSKIKPTDHPSSDSGLSMDDHLEWLTDSSLFDL